MDTRNFSALLQQNTDTTDKVRAHNYGPVYDVLLGPYVGQNIRFLEIGVFAGGSTKAIEQFLGVRARICAVDPVLSNIRNSYVNVTFIEGDAFAEATIQQIVHQGPLFDVILDDSFHTLDSHRTLLTTHYDRLLAPGGLLILEDVMYSLEQVQELCREFNCIYIDNRHNLPYPRSVNPRDHDGSIIIVKRKPY